jgi:hypothetical protein
MPLMRNAERRGVHATASVTQPGTEAPAFVRLPRKTIALDAIVPPRFLMSASSPEKPSARVRGTWLPTSFRVTRSQECVTR